MNRIMGLDVGTKRIGIALSVLFSAQPLETIDRQPEKDAISKIKVVIGLPKNMNGTLGVQAEDCMNFANLLKDDYEIIFEDERLTSRQAEGILALQGKKYTKNKGLVDLKSACIILQQYLDKA